MKFPRVIYPSYAGIRDRSDNKRWHSPNVVALYAPNASDNSMEDAGVYQACISLTQPATRSRAARYRPCYATLVGPRIRANTALVPLYRYSSHCLDFFLLTFM